MEDHADWSLPASWLAADANQRRVAEDTRAEANTFRDAMYAARDAGKPADVVRALHISYMCAVGHAASIERTIRGIA